jgi:hypothetical protein
MRRCREEGSRSWVWCLHDAGGSNRLAGRFEPVRKLRGAERGVGKAGWKVRVTVEEEEGGTRTSRATSAAERVRASSQTAQCNTASCVVRAATAGVVAGSDAAAAKVLRGSQGPPPSHIFWCWRAQRSPGPPSKLPVCRSSPPTVESPPISHWPVMRSRCVLGKHAVQRCHLRCNAVSACDESLQRVKNSRP